MIGERVIGGNIVRQRGGRPPCTDSAAAEAIKGLVPAPLPALRCAINLPTGLRRLGHLHWRARHRAGVTGGDDVRGVGHGGLDYAARHFGRLHG